MDLIRLLPYEILQHIATWLLPRHQCRLAMASKWCYHYLYDNLLRWHAKWALNKIPQHNIYGENLPRVNQIISVLVIPTEQPRVLIFRNNLYRRIITFTIENLTSMRTTMITRCHRIGKQTIYDKNMHVSEMNTHFEAYHKIDILANCYDYVRKDLLMFYLMYFKPEYSRRLN